MPSFLKLLPFSLVFANILIGLPVTCRAWQSLDVSTSEKHRSVSKITDTARQFEIRGDRKSALLYHHRALQRSRAYHMPEQEARILLNIGLILKKEDAGKSLVHLQAALAIAKEINNQVLQSEIYLSISEVYRQQQNYSEALHALDAHQQLFGNMLAENKAREAARIRLEDKRVFERRLWLAVLSGVILITLILGFYFIKTKKLNRELRRSNLVKDKLFSVLGHDLKGPAGNITQSLALISAGLLSQEETQELITLLQKQSEALSETLNSLLKWAHTQLKGVQRHPTLFEACGVIKKNIEILSGQAGDKHIKIENHTPAGLLLLMDEDHFDISLRNLLSNAIKFSHTGGIIKINSEERKDEIIFSVTDKGVGISVSRQKEFNHTEIGVSFGTQGEKGTGLGLLLIRELIQADGGRIWLVSEEGKGSTFYFSIKKQR